MLDIVTFKGRAAIRGRRGSGPVPGRAIWMKYGLSLPESGTLTKPELERGIRSHDLVAAYLESHPEVAKRYTPDQRAKVKYYDVLAMAENVTE